MPRELVLPFLSVLEYSKKCDEQHNLFHAAFPIGVLFGKGGEGTGCEDIAKGVGGEPNRLSPTQYSSDYYFDDDEDDDEEDEDDDEEESAGGTLSSGKSSNFVTSSSPYFNSLRTVVAPDEPRAVVAVREELEKIIEL